MHLRNLFMLPPRCRIPWLRAAMIIGLVGMLLGGSARADWSWSRFEPAFKPANVWKLQERFSPDLRRVAVLPVTAAAGVPMDEDSRQMLEDALRAQLARGHRLEVVSVPAARLRAWTGRPSARAQEVLPAKLFASLKEAFACDLVLFVEVTEFRAYAPLRVGWHLKLVDAAGQVPWWEADELFDGSNQRVANAARRDSRTRIGGLLASDDWSLRTSPRLFAEYSVGALLATLPQR